MENTYEKKKIIQEITNIISFNICNIHISKSTKSKELASKIDEQKTYNKELVAEKENVNSKEYIEQIAREKLDMYYPNEKIYIDKGM